MVKFRFGFDLPFTDPDNKALTLAAAGSILATTLVCEVPALANAFGFTPVSLAEYAVAAVFGTAGLFIVELVKHFQRKTGC